MMDLLVFPNQLYSVHPGFKRKPRRVVLLEDSLFFGDSRYPARFHKQKLWFHRSSMKRYEQLLRGRGFKTEYIEYAPKASALRDILLRLRGKSRQYRLLVSDPTDFILEQRLQKHCDELNIDVEILRTPTFLNTREENAAYRIQRNRWFMADFYKWQRQRLNLLMDGESPCGGRWSFDDENRKKVPKNLLSSIPCLPAVARDAIDAEAKAYVMGRFSRNPGSLDALYYPTSHRAARKWLKQFLKIRLKNFGDYEDAIVPGQSWLWHSVLTPMLNTGLLTPKEVVKATLDFADANDVPLNSLEGFLRQVVGASSCGRLIRTWASRCEPLMLGDITERCPRACTTAQPAFSRSTTQSSES